MSKTLEIIEHHLGSFHAGDIDGLMADYTDKSVLFTTNGTLIGRRAIRGMFEGLYAEFSKPGARFTMHTQSAEGEVAYIVWSAETADNHYEFATDTFVVRDGRIAYQSFAGKVVPRS